MKQLFKTFSLTVFLLAGSVLFFSLFNSCSNRVCNQFCVGLSAISLTAINNADSMPKEPINGSVIAKAFMLSLQMEDTQRVGCIVKIENPFISNAFATYRKCPTPIGLMSYSITSNTDFDSSHSANSILNDLFYAPKPPAGSHGEFSFYLLKEPTIESEHIFTITVISSERDTLIASTNPIILRKS